MRMKNQFCTAFIRTFEIDNMKGMESSVEKNERIELRVSAADKALFQKAQRLSGDRSFSSFVVRVLKSHAREIISENDRILATEQDRQIFFDAVFGATKPNETLLAAVAKYKSANLVR